MALGFGFDLMSQAVRQRPWTPRFLFGDGEQGAWYDPSDFTTLYQDSAGTTPVTALGQPVGLMQDKSGNGNHASQSTDAARPTVQARVNLLERTEEFDQSPWSAFQGSVSVAIGPDGTSTAGLFEENLIFESHYFGQTITKPAQSLSYTATAYVKDSGRQILWVIRENSFFNRAQVVFDASSGTVVSAASVAGTFSNVSFDFESVGGGWYRLTMSFTTGTDTALINRLQGYLTTSVYTGTGAGFYVWHPQLERGTSATTYQRVTTATDYQDIGLPRYLEFDGVDDAMATQSVDFSASDEMTMCAGVYKATTTVGIVYELSADLNTNNGGVTFTLGPASSSQDIFVSKGTGTQLVRSGSNTAPRTDVWTGRADISQPLVQLRANGAVLDTNTNTQGTGNYGDHPLYIGARGGTTLEFNGRIHQLIIRGATTAGNLLDQTERFVARKTGVTL